MIVILDNNLILYNLLNFRNPRLYENDGEEECLSEDQMELVELDTPILVKTKSKKSKRYLNF